MRTHDLERAAASTGDRLGYLAGVAGLAFAITAFWLGMRSVMDIGGMCASGGPYEVAVPCPPGVDVLMVLAFPVGFASVGVMVWKGAPLGPRWVGLAALAWPALFLSLGWNFLEYGLWPPYGGGPELGWLIPGVIFVLMGGIPLWLYLQTRGDAPIVPGISGTRGRSDVKELRDLRDAMARAATSARRKGGPAADQMTVFQATHLAAPASVPSPATEPSPPTRPSPAVSTPAPATAPNEVLVAQLERVAALHRAGDLSLLEFQEAKAALLATARGER
jgi:hypothetical protein